MSKCSQVISVMTGFFGMFCMGISVSILSRYLQLTFDEYCMLSYYMDADIEKQKQQAAALIIKAAWQEYRNRRSEDVYLRLKMQRNLLKALHYKKYVEYKKISSRERRERQVRCSFRKLLNHTKRNSKHQHANSTGLYGLKTKVFNKF